MAKRIGTQLMEVIAHPFRALAAIDGLDRRPSSEHGRANFLENVSVLYAHDLLCPADILLGKRGVGLEASRTSEPKELGLCTQPTKKPV